MALVITVIILLILAGVAISMITGEQGLFAQTNHAANTYKAAQENEAIHLDALMNSEYLTGLTGFNLSLSTASTTEVSISGSTTGNGRFDALDGVNSPDISKLPDTSTYYVTWASNTSDPTENVAKTSSNGNPSNVPTAWYDYDAGKWANIKSGANSLEAYWVWIPRFAYLVPNSAIADK